MSLIRLHLHVALEVRLPSEQLLAHRARVQRHLQVHLGLVVGVRGHVLDEPGLMAVALVTQLTHVWLVPVLHLALVDEVTEWSSAGKHAPVVRVTLVHVAVELLIIKALLLANLARQVMGPSQRRVKLKQRKKNE